MVKTETSVFGSGRVAPMTSVYGIGQEVAVEIRRGGSAEAGWIALEINGDSTLTFFGRQCAPFIAAMRELLAREDA